MLNTDANTFILLFFVSDIKQALIINPRILQELHFGTVAADNLSEYSDLDHPNASGVGKFKEQFNFDFIFQ